MAQREAWSGPSSRSPESQAGRGSHVSDPTAPVSTSALSCLGTNQDGCYYWNDLTDEERWSGSWKRAHSADLSQPSRLGSGLIPPTRTLGLAASLSPVLLGVWSRVLCGPVRRAGPRPTCTCWVRVSR